MIDTNHSPQLNLVLALSGGGTRGYAHVGVLQALEEAAIPIDGIAGCSAGGMIGGMYAAGFTPDELAAEVRYITSIRGMIRSFAPSFGRGQRLSDQFRVDYRFRENLSKYIGPELTFDQLRLPFAVNVVCLTHYDEVMLNSGSVADAVRATVSVPGMFNAVEVGDCRYVDGGVINNVPTNIARAMGGKFVVAVDVGDGHLGPNARHETDAFMGSKTMKDLLDTVNLLTSRFTKLSLAQSPPDFMIRPKLPKRSFPLSDFTQVDALIQAGYEAGQAAAQTLRAKLNL
ncbi:MAG: patatin-like phospholipase family protein [Candidatus Promineifilaceae bacterium]